MGRRGGKSWWSSSTGFFVSIILMGGVLYGALSAAILLVPPIGDTMRAEPSAPKFAFARWTVCDAADARGTDTVLVPIWRFREAERFLAELGCHLPAAKARR